MIFDLCFSQPKTFPTKSRPDGEYFLSHFQMLLLLLKQNENNFNIHFSGLSFISNQFLSTLDFFLKIINILAILIYFSYVLLFFLSRLSIKNSVTLIKVAVLTNSVINFRFYFKLVSLVPFNKSVIPWKICGLPYLTLLKKNCH